jgi:hypothetical protein
MSESPEARERRLLREAGTFPYTTSVRASRRARAHQRRVAGPGDYISREERPLIESSEGGYCAACGRWFPTERAHRIHDTRVHGMARTTYVPSAIYQREYL